MFAFLKRKPEKPNPLWEYQRLEEIWRKGEILEEDFTYEQLELLSTVGFNLGSCFHPIPIPASGDVYCMAKEEMTRRRELKQEQLRKQKEEPNHDNT